MRSSNKQPSFTNIASPVVNLDILCNQEADSTNAQNFLKEADTYKTLMHKLAKFSNIQHIKKTSDIIPVIQQTISAIDHLINDQLNHIIHHSKYQKLEASWRGLSSLVKHADGNKNIKIKVLDISWSEVVRDIGKALEFDQSQLFHKIYNEEYGIAGGEPYGVLIGDYEISHQPSARHPHDDISTLEGLAEIAAAAFAPFITSASSELFGMDDFSMLGMPINLENIFAQQEYIKWRALREKSDSRFIGLILPRILMRLPYQTKPGTYNGIFFYEKCAASNAENYLWGNACYAFAGILLREFANVGWFGHIRGVPRNQISGGLLSTLIVDEFATDAQGIAPKTVTDVLITDNLEREISNLGFVPLCQCYGTPFAAFYSNQSVQKPKLQNNKSIDINARLSTMLQHVLCASRIAHYIKVIIRDKVGSFISASECQEYLREWLYKYTTGREDMDWEEQARYPLREAAVQVREHPEKPGQYLCVIHLRPHYQLDHMTSELELVTELTQKN